MHSALWISKTGLDSTQTDIATISNNIANVSTVGFKKSRAVFEDLLYQNINQPGSASSANTQRPSGLMQGTGSKVAAVQKVYTQGNIQTTDNSLDWAISGPGFFEILMPDGNIAYTRNGQFGLDDQGQIVTSGSGYVLQPAMAVPENAQSVSISADGQVSAQIPGQPVAQVIGQLTISDFINPSGLEPIGENLLVETGVSGAPIQGNPSLDGLGSIQQGALETSNVNVTEELVNLIESQRAYEMNSKVISSVDQMLSYLTQQL